MKILHYMLGIPPVRGGGLIRYATDLMRQEMSMGEKVRLLIPGPIPWDSEKAVAVRKVRAYMGIPADMVCNPLPVPMGNGILAIDAFTRACDGKVFEDYLSMDRPDVIHLHSLMGLHKEFLAAAKKLGVPVIFTSHDYFGICPVANMMSAGHICMDKDWKSCGACCRNAYSMKKLRLEQSRPYRCYRKHGWLVGLAHYGIFKKLFRPVMAQKAANAEENTYVGSILPDGAGQPDYGALKRYYEDMFRLVSYFHFNSSLAKKIYIDRLGNIKGSIVNVTHAAVRDNRRIRSYGHRLRLGYFGNWSEYKGFDMLLGACGRLYEQGCPDMELHVYSDTDTRKEKFVINHKNFRPGQQAQAFQDIDVLVVPSRWPETFGFVVLEACCYGVPVIMSELVGARDVFRKNPEAVFVYGKTEAELEKMIKKIYDDRELLVKANAGIFHMDYGFSYEKHVQEILEIYRYMR